MTILRFQIQHSTGRVEQINVEAERALIGSGAHCEIRLPIDQAALEHVLIQVGGGNVFAQALTFQPPPTINAVPFTQAPLPADAVLGIGQTQILVNVSDEVGAGAVITKQKQKASPVTLLAAAALGGIIIYLVNAQPAVDEIGPQPKEPALFGAAIESCDIANPTAALARAREKHILAEAKRERRPFHVQDGVAAVPAYEEASACYRKGGDVKSANETIDLANTLRREMEDDYRTHRMRLEHSITVADDKTAWREVKTLLAFTEGKSGPYVDWLSQLDRRYKLKLGRTS